MNILIVIHYSSLRCLLKEKTANGRPQVVVKAFVGTRSPSVLLAWLQTPLLSCEKPHTKGMLEVKSPYIAHFTPQKNTPRHIRLTHPAHPRHLRLATAATVLDQQGESHGSTALRRVPSDFESSYLGGHWSSVVSVCFETDKKQPTNERAPKTEILRKFI